MFATAADANYDCQLTKLLLIKTRWSICLSVQLQPALGSISVLKRQCCSICQRHRPGGRAGQGHRLACAATRQCKDDQGDDDDQT